MHDDTTEKLERLSQRVQRVEDALGIAGRDLTNEPLARRLERIEESVAALRVAARPAPKGPDQPSARDLESVRRAQQDMQRLLDRLQRAVQDGRAGAGDWHRLETQLGGLQRTLTSLESRVSRLERG
jgi:chromosome segregation ATPase